MVNKVKTEAELIREMGDRLAKINGLDTAESNTTDNLVNSDATPQETKLNFDIVDDAVVFMRNDPQFYRKKYYPTVSNMANRVKGGKDPDRSVLGTMVDSGMNSYCKKYNLGRGPADLFTSEDRNAIIEKICSEELIEIEKGSY